MSVRALTSPPAAVDAGGRVQYGRFDGPIPYVNIGERTLDRFRRKEWHYTAIDTRTHFVAFAVVQLGYVANVFAYVVDKSRADTPHTMERVIPFGRDLAISPSSIEGETLYTHGDDRLRIHYRLDAFRVDVDLGIGGERLVGSFDCLAGPSLSMVHALSPTRPAYTHKGTTYRVDGALSYGRAKILPAAFALGSLDWTRSLADRTTRWKWASFSTHANGTALGLNLSADVYDDDDGNSEENVFFDGDRARPLGGVRFDVPSSPRSMPWRITSREGDDVDLTFTPYGAREQALDLRIVKSAFVQPYGVFRGRVLDRAIDEAFGVVEDHLSVW